MMQHLRHLQEKHAYLDARIHEELSRPSGDDLTVRRLKREKLLLKQEIESLRKTG